MTDLDDLPFTHDDGRIPNGAKGRPTCRRHEWTPITQIVSANGVAHAIEPPYAEWCRRCGTYRDDTRSRRGRSSLRAGKDAERAIAKAYGGRRTGQYGGPDDVVVGDLFVIQSKATDKAALTVAFPEWMWDELAKLPRAGGRIPTLVVSDRPGPGHRTRRLVIRTLEDDVALHGEKR